jgi:hypothetical protein
VVALRDVGARIDYPLIPDVSTSVRDRMRAAPGRVIRLWPRSRTIRRVLVLAAALLALLAGAAVAGRLGVPGLRIIFSSENPPANIPVGRNLFLGTRMSLEEARHRAAFPVFTPDGQGLGPATVYWADNPVGGHVSLVYGQTPELPRSRFTRAGLLITEFRGKVNEDFIRKTGVPGTRLRSVTVNGSPGYWLAGMAHEIVFVDAKGHPYAESLRLAGNTLVWTRGEVTLRLECNCSKATALGIAESMR